MEMPMVDSVIVGFQFNNHKSLINNYLGNRRLAMPYSSKLDSSTWEPGSASCSDAAEGSIKESSRSWESPAGFSDFRWTLRSIFSRCLSCRERSFRRLLKLERLRPAMRTSTGDLCRRIGRECRTGTVA